MWKKHQYFFSVCILFFQVGLEPVAVGEPFQGALDQALTFLIFGCAGKVSANTWECLGLPLQEFLPEQAALDPLHRGCVFDLIFTVSSWQKPCEQKASGKTQVQECLTFSADL